MNKKNLLFSFGTVGAIAAAPLMALSCTTQEQVKATALQKLIADCKTDEAVVAANAKLKGDAASYTAAINAAQATLDKYNKKEKVNADQLDKAITALKSKFARVKTEALLAIIGTEPQKDAALEGNKDKKDEYLKLYNAYLKQWKGFSALANKPAPDAADYNAAAKLLAKDKDGKDAPGSFNAIKAKFEADVKALSEKK